MGGTAEGWALAERLRVHSADLGIQCLIYARRIWSNVKADQGWRLYTGVAHHDEHIHVELTRQAAAQLSVAEIERVLAPPSPSPDGTTEGDDDVKLAEAMVNIDELYLAYTAAYIPADDRAAWGRDLAFKIFAKGEDPHPTLQFIEWKLREQATARAGG